MRIGKKLIYFGIGLFLGILLVKFFFGGREDIQCSYFPNDRVLYDLRGKAERIITPEASFQLEALDLDTSDVSQMLFQGKVQFDKSNTESDSCNSYYIEYAKLERRFGAQFFNCDSSAVLYRIEPID